MIVTTTPTVEGHTIKEYKGIVSGEVIFGMNFVKDFFAAFHDKWGGRSSGDALFTIAADMREHMKRDKLK
jgi:uncharacterized protein YbjQ (UPF0145 family)